MSVVSAASWVPGSVTSKRTGGAAGAAPSAATQTAEATERRRSGLREPGRRCDDVPDAARAHGWMARDAPRYRFDFNYFRRWRAPSSAPSRSARPVCEPREAVRVMGERSTSGTRVSTIISRGRRCPCTPAVHFAPGYVHPEVGGGPFLVSRGGSILASAEAPPQNGQGPSGTSTSASTCSGTGRCAGGCPGFRPGFFGSLLRWRRRNGAACRFRPRCACSRRCFRSLFSSTSRAFSPFSASFSVRRRAHSDRSNRISARGHRLCSSTSEAGMHPRRGGLPGHAADLATASDHPAYIQPR